MIAHDVIKTDPKIIQLFLNYPISENMLELKGFLGITGNYREFGKNYATIAKPLTRYLSAENGKVSNKHVKKI